MIRKKIWIMQAHWLRYCAKRRVKKNEKKLKELVEYATEPDDELDSGMTGYEFDRGVIAHFPEIKSSYVQVKEKERTELREKKEQIKKLGELWQR